VDLEKYTSQGPHHRPDDRYRVLLVEGSLMGGYEMGLENAVMLLERLNSLHNHELDRPAELMVVGKVTESYKARWEGLPSAPIIWAGLVPSERIPEIDRSAHLLYSADVNAACPNSVVEALACGLPVLSFDTGALPEMVIGNAGRIVPYGGDPWRLEDPDLDGLAVGAVKILNQQDRFRGDARKRAESAFDLDRMVEGYARMLLP
jgi:glycosyltransferase involved in cell wall biosynthesis